MPNLGNFLLLASFALKLAEVTNEDPRGKWVQATFLRAISYSWVRAAIANRMFVEGLETERT